jgi:hypothetical protein
VADWVIVSVTESVTVAPRVCESVACAARVCESVPAEGTPPPPSVAVLQNVSLEEPALVPLSVVSPVPVPVPNSSRNSLSWLALRPVRVHHGVRLTVRPR